MWFYSLEFKCAPLWAYSILPPFSCQLQKPIFATSVRRSLPLTPNCLSSAVHTRGLTLDIFISTVGFIDVVFRYFFEGWAFMPDCGDAHDCWYPTYRGGPPSLATIWDIAKPIFNYFSTITGLCLPDPGSGYLDQLWYSRFLLFPPSNDR